MNSRQKMESELKRRKINPPRHHRVSPHHTTKETLPKATDRSMSAGAHLDIQQAKNFAIGQAQHEGCTANFRIFDSPFGNFLIPAIPTRAELSGGTHS